MDETIDWDKVIKKEARGLDDYDLGEVQEVNEDVVITKKGVVDKDKFYLPRSKALRFEEDNCGSKLVKMRPRHTSTIRDNIIFYILLISFILASITTHMLVSVFFMFSKTQLINSISVFPA